jgi:hypothetical protein
MKYVFSTVLLLSTLFCFGQFDRTITLVTAANFSVPLKGAGVNEAGFGISFDAHFFSKQRLQVLLESSADYFVGAKEGGFLSIFSSAGPQFFVTKNIAASVTYGTPWNAEVWAHGFKYSISGFKERFTAKVFMINLPDRQKGDIQYVGIRYIGVSAGVRIL